MFAMIVPPLLKGGVDFRKPLNCNLSMDYSVEIIYVGGFRN